MHQELPPQLQLGVGYSILRSYAGEKSVGGIEFCSLLSGTEAYDCTVAVEGGGRRLRVTEAVP